MNINILTSQKSSSLEAMKKTSILSASNGGVTQDFSANVENIREISRKMGTDILPSIGPLRNLIKYSEDYTNSIWYSDGPSPTKTTNATIDPNGTNTATKLSEYASSSIFDMGQIKTTITNRVYTFSVYLKAAERNYVNLLITNAVVTFGASVNFDLTAGTVSTAVQIYGTPTNVSANISNVGNGWYRCSLTTSVGGTSSYAQVSLKNDNSIYGTNHVGIAGYGIYVWGAQFEQNSSPTTYQPTKEFQTNTELLSANFLFVPSSYGEGKIFSQNPNLRNQWFLDSESIGPLISDGVVAKSLNVIANPLNGLINADKLMEVSGQTFCSIYRYFGTKPLQTYTFSVYLKAAERTAAKLKITSGVQCNFNLTAGTFSGLANETGYGNFAINQRASIENVGNGWYRCSISCTYNVFAIGFGISTVFPSIAIWDIILNNNPTPMTDGYGIYVWGMQMEISPTSTTYQRVTDNLSDFTFTRATSSTITNEQGVIEDSCYNGLVFSEQFDNGSYTKSNVTISPNVTIAPNGTLTADKYVEGTNNGFRYIYQIASGIANIPYTLSIYAKKAERTWLLLGISDNIAKYFDLTNGVLGNSGGAVINASIEDVGNGWYRCSMTAIPVGSFRMYIEGVLANGSNNYQGDGVSGIYIWGSQFVIGSTPRPYLRTTNRLNVPKLDYSLNLNEPSLLIEPQRTNLLLQSDSIGAWSYPNSSITSDIIVNPTTGLQNADKQIPSTDYNWHNVYQYLSTLANGTYTFTCYVKNAGYNFAVIGFARNNSIAEEQFIVDLTSGNISNIMPNANYTNVLRSVISFPNGWYKVIMTATINGISAGITPFIGISNTDTGIIYGANQPNFVGDGTSGIYISSTQLEAGSNATTYIPTTTATVTRNADTCYVDLFNNNMLNQNNFTLYVEGYLYGFIDDWNFHLGSTQGYSTTDAIGFQRGLRALYFISGAASIVGTDMAVNNYYKVIIQVNGTTIKFFRNGVQLGTTQTIRTFDYRYLNIVGATTYTIDKIALFNKTLTDGECINLTSPTNNSFESLASAYTYTIIT